RGYDVHLGCVTCRHAGPRTSNAAPTCTAGLQVAPTIPNATASRNASVFMGGQHVIANVDLTNIHPLITPPLSPKIGTGNAFTDLTAVTVTPTISWTAPTTGTVGTYVVFIDELAVDGTGSMSAIRVARLLVPGNVLSVAVPAGVLASGRYYYATI